VFFVSIFNAALLWQTSTDTIFIFSNYCCFPSSFVFKQPGWAVIRLLSIRNTKPCRLEGFSTLFFIAIGSWKSTYFYYRLPIYGHMTKNIPGICIMGYPLQIPGKKIVITLRNTEKNANRTTGILLPKLF
jgi:hypothetical protein